MRVKKEREGECAREKTLEKASEKRGIQRNIYIYSAR